MDRTPARTFQDLLVWQKGLDLAVRCYELVRRFPKPDQMVLGYQIRKSSLSIPSNIAEGKATGGQRYRRHLKFALGSNAELQTQLELAMRLGMLDKRVGEELQVQASEIGRMLAGLFKALPKT